MPFLPPNQQHQSTEVVLERSLKSPEEVLESIKSLNSEVTEEEVLWVTQSTDPNYEILSIRFIFYWLQDS